MQQPPYDPNQPTWQGLPQQSLPSSPGWQPPPPPTKPPFWKRKAGCMPMWLLIVIIGVISLYILVSIVSAASNGGNGTNATPTIDATATQQDALNIQATATREAQIQLATIVAAPTDTPVPPPQPTPKPTPMPATIPASAAVLGGTIAAFDNKFGDNNCCHYNGWDVGNNWVGVYTVQDGENWYQAVGEHSNEQVVGINIHPYNTDITNANTPVWNTIQAAEKVCGAYLPPDAKLKTSSGSSLEYYSAALANTLLKSDFTDTNNHLEQPGLFFVNYDNYNSSSQIDYCLIGTDRGLQRENSIGR